MATATALSVLPGCQLRLLAFPFGTGARGDGWDRMDLCVPANIHSAFLKIEEHVSVSGGLGFETHSRHRLVNGIFLFPQGLLFSAIPLAYEQSTPVKFYPFLPANSLVLKDGPDSCGR